MKTYPGINTYLLMIKNKFSRLSRKKAVSLTIVTVILVLFPTHVLLFANGLLEFVGAIIAFIYAARWGLLDGESDSRSPRYFSESGYGGDDGGGDKEKYQNEVDLGFH